MTEKSKVFLSFLTFVAICAPSPCSTENKEILDNDGKVVLSWSVLDNQTITFELEAETKGYVGFGISPTGSMAGGDIFIAGVHDNGTTYASDRHGTGFTTPIIDEVQDWVLHEAKEMIEGNTSTIRTYLKFSRLLDTCDDEGDYPIGLDTNRLIWALGEDDVIQYHGPMRRGTKSVNLLGSPMPEVELGKMQEWRMTLDMVMPSNDTAYWCSFHKGPKLNKKHHIVAFDAILPDPHALAHTHHFILYNCYKSPYDDVPLEDILGNYTVDKGYLGDHCYIPYDPSSPTPPRYYCPEYLYVWAKGGKRMSFPQNVGYPIGYGGDQVERELFYMLEIHYDNPEKKVGLQFETGVAFYYTNETREHDAGQLMVGHDVSPTLLVPPNTTDFVVAGHCSANCTQTKFPTGGINVFNVLLHAHLSGRKLKLRQFRDGVELPWPDWDDHYDFDYQQNKPLGKEVVILPGDSLTYECTYDSWWKGGRVVIGDLSTRDEMCESFIWYYPKIEELDVCGSSYDWELSMADLGITEYEMLSVVGNPKVWIKQPLELEGDFEESISTKYNWTEERKGELQRKRRYEEHIGFCFYRKDTEPSDAFPVTYPLIERPYEPEDICQATPTTEAESETPTPTTSLSSSSPTHTSESPSSPPTTQSSRGSPLSQTFSVGCLMLLLTLWMYCKTIY